MNKDLVKGITLQIDETKRLGVMRIDWAGSGVIQVAAPSYKFAEDVDF